MAPRKIGSKQPSPLNTGFSHHQRRWRHQAAKKQRVDQLACPEPSIFGPGIAGRSDNAVRVDYIHGSEHETQTWVVLEALDTICKKARRNKIVRVQERQILASRFA